MIFHISYYYCRSEIILEWYYQWYSVHVRVRQIIRETSSVTIWLPGSLASRHHCHGISTLLWSHTTWRVHILYCKRSQVSEICIVILSFVTTIKASANKIKILVLFIWTPQHFTYLGWTFAVESFSGVYHPQDTQNNGKVKSVLPCRKSCICHH